MRRHLWPAARLVQQKSPMLSTPGLDSPLGFIGLASTALEIVRARRITGGSRRILATQDLSYALGRHFALMMIKAREFDRTFNETHQPATMFARRFKFFAVPGAWEPVHRRRDQWCLPPRLGS